jgi:hypothetical protein
LSEKSSSVSALPSNKKTPPQTTVVLTAATSTDQVLEPSDSQAAFTLRGQFQDRIIKNKDVREFVTANGTLLFLYSFIDTTHLVVSGSESALGEIVGRLEKQAFVR